MADSYGNYEIIEELGRGGFGIAYKAKKIYSSEIVVLKTVIPEIGVNQNQEKAQRFQREIKIIETLYHPNIVNFIEYGIESDGIYYFVMEYCNGGSVADLIEVSSNKYLSIEESLHITNRVLDGLIATHDSENKIIHRDIKPGNILLNYDSLENGELNKSQRPQVKLTDYGLAKALDTSGLSSDGFRTPTIRIETEDNSQRAKYKALELPGSHGFMSRRQMRDFKYAEPYVDIWATTATLYYMLTGCYPRDFSNVSNKLEIVEVVRKQPPISIQTRIEEKNLSIPQEFGDLLQIIDRTLSESGKPPYQTAAEFKQALDRAIPNSFT